MDGGGRLPLAFFFMVATPATPAQSPSTTPLPLPFLRGARRDDCAAMADIYNHYILHDTCTYRTEPETEDQRAAWLAAHGPKHTALVAEADGRVVGWASLSEFDSRGACARTVEDSI